MERQPVLEDIQAAHERIRRYIHRTPILTCISLDEMFGVRLYFKCESFQKVGAFKFRGACNALFSLDKKYAEKGVVTHSSGNHAAALSLAARKRGIQAYIVMPSNAPKVKIAAVKNYGGHITFCEPTLESRETTAEKIIEETGATMIHPFNNYDIIAGQGTAALELLSEIDDLDFIMAPVGGGGLISGTALAAKAMKHEIKVFGCEPKNADDAYKSKNAGVIIPANNPDTIADGLKTSLGDKTFPIIRDYVDEILLATEKQIVHAMQLIFERMKIIVEPSSAVPLAALIDNNIKNSNKKIGIILSGGNVELNKLFSEIIS